MTWVPLKNEFHYKGVHAHSIYTHSMYGGAHTGKGWRQMTSSMHFLLIPLDLGNLVNSSGCLYF